MENLHFQHVQKFGQSNHLEDHHGQQCLDDLFVCYLVMKISIFRSRGAMVISILVFPTDAVDSIVSR